MAEARARGEFLDLRGLDLRGADLHGADLQGADLQGANLRGVNLRDADLRDADLRGAFLQGANLQYADLRGADLRGVNLRGADLQGAIGIFIVGPLGCFGDTLIVNMHSDGPRLYGCDYSGGTADEFRAAIERMRDDQGRRECRAALALIEAWAAGQKWDD